MYSIDVLDETQTKKGACRAYDNHMIIVVIYLMYLGTCDQGNILLIENILTKEQHLTLGIIIITSLLYTKITYLTWRCEQLTEPVKCLDS